MRTAPALLIAALATACLAGCAKQPGPLTFEQIQTIAADLGGDRERVYQTELAYTPLNPRRPTTQKIYLIPLAGGSFRIVDANGMVYQDYRDFLRNNTMGD
jgi:hypothetical protein